MEFVQHSCPEAVCHRVWLANCPERRPGQLDLLQAVHEVQQHALAGLEGELSDAEIDAWVDQLTSPPPG